MSIPISSASMMGSTAGGGSRLALQTVATPSDDPEVAKFVALARAVFGQVFVDLLSGIGLESYQARAWLFSDDPDIIERRDMFAAMGDVSVEAMRTLVETGDRDMMRQVARRMGR